MQEDRKCVLILDEGLPLGILANTAAILGLTLGKHMPEAIGEDVSDQDGNCHLGIIEFPVPILKGNSELLREIRSKLYTSEFAQVLSVDFSKLAQGCKEYQEYVNKMTDTKEETLEYLGIALCGDKKKINKLTGSLPLLR